MGYCDMRINGDSDEDYASFIQRSFEGEVVVDSEAGHDWVNSINRSQWTRKISGDPTRENLDNAFGNILQLLGM
jgi:hypothetical protein